MTQYTVFLLAFAASAAAPGPEIAGLLARALSNGMFASLPLALGIILGKLVMLTAAVVGLSALIEVLGPMFVALKFGGAAYLIWLGIKKWKNAGRVLAATEATKPLNFATEIGLGLAMTLSNPIAIVFYMALLPGVIDVSGITLASYAILCAIITAVMIAIALGYGLVAEIARKLFSSSMSKARIDRSAGAMMVGAGILIAGRSATT
ncbi:LysE family translocator [Microvirga alba]|uniref:LysE family translocator n=1 Tax=Microvirga alba TaxID=2791025 RepID=A0A931BST7_9HYPH|nr:LysE family translocator [Microvirga alba]MBF9233155.1 LysE family translocator [Microvirga alba]